MSDVSFSPEQDRKRDDDKRRKKATVSYPFMPGKDELSELSPGK